jgi:hypothetical protein
MERYRYARSLERVMSVIEDVRKAFVQDLVASA